MDETGHSGDTGPADDGAGSESHDRARVNGWMSPESARPSPWSNAGAALDPADEEIPAWRRPSQEIRPFTRQPLPPDHRADDSRPFHDQNQSSEVRPFSSPPNPFGYDRWSTSGEVRPFGDTGRSSWSGEVRPPDPEPPAPASAPPAPTRPASALPASGLPASGFSASDFPASTLPPSVAAPAAPTSAVPVSAPAADEAPRWSDSRTRYSDLLHHFAPRGDDAAAAPSRFDALTRPGVLNQPERRDAPAEDDARGAGRMDELTRPGSFEDDGTRSAGRMDPSTRPGTLEDDDRRSGRLDPPASASAPPYPYEGDLDDARHQAGVAPQSAIQQRAAFPMERPLQPFPAVRPATPGARRAEPPATADPARHALDQVRGTAGPGSSSGGVGAMRPSYDSDSLPNRFSTAGDPGATPIGDQISRTLPQRVPAEPDVPIVPEPPSVEPTAETPALARIATHLRRGDTVPAQERQDGFDVGAILEAVREVEGVRDASLRSTPAGAHSLRLDLAEGADPAEVSRHVARLLQDRMGLDAAMQGATDFPPIPAQPAPTRPAPARPLSAQPTTVQPTSAQPAQAQPTHPTSGQPAQSAPAQPASPQPVQPAPPQPAPAQASAVVPAPAPTLPSAPPVNSPPVSAFVPSQTASGTSGRATVAGDGLQRLPTIPVAGRVTSREAPAEQPDKPVTVETVSSGQNCPPPRPLEVNERPGPRVVIENVQVNTFGTEATVEVRLAVGGRTASGIATGPAVDGYLLRLCAMATAAAVDDLLSASDHVDGPARCFVEHAASVPFGPMEVAVVVLLLSCGGWVEQLAGSAVVTGDDRHAMVRATLAAVNRRLEALLS